MSGFQEDREAARAALPPLGVITPVIPLTKTIDLALVSEVIAAGRGVEYQLAIEGLALTALLIRKNRDYGNSATSRPLLCNTFTARQGIQCRMSDKVARLVTAFSGKVLSVKESTRDTVKDLAGYCLLWLVSDD